MKLYRSKATARRAAKRHGGRTVKIVRYKVSKAGGHRKRRRKR